MLARGKWVVVGATAFVAAAGVYSLRHQTRKPSLDGSDAFVPLRVIHQQALTPTAWHVRLHCEPFHVHPDGCYHVNVAEDQSQSIRAFTPVHTPSPSEPYLDLIVRTYPWPYGEVARSLVRAQPGSFVRVQGPVISLRWNEALAKRPVVMVCGGTGITPMVQVLRYLKTHAAADSAVTLIYANRSIQEIIAKHELEEIQAAKSLRIVHVIEDVKDNETTTTTTTTMVSGRVTLDLLRQSLPPPEANPLILVSGPSGMMESVCGDKRLNDERPFIGGWLKQLGYAPEHVFRF